MPTRASQHSAKEPAPTNHAAKRTPQNRLRQAQHQISPAPKPLYPPANPTMTTISQQPNVKNCQPALDFTRPFMDDKTLSISALSREGDHHYGRRRAHRRRSLGGHRDDRFRLRGLAQLASAWRRSDRPRLARIVSRRSIGPARDRVSQLGPRVKSGGENAASAVSRTFVAAARRQSRRGQGRDGEGASPHHCGRPYRSTGRRSGAVRRGRRRGGCVWREAWL
jgi:hypothetical protein